MDEMSANQQIVFYLFHSPTNGESQIIRRMLREVIPEKDSRIRLQEVDFDNEKEFCAKLRVYGTPTLLIQFGEDKIQRFSGVLNVQEIRKIIDDLSS